MNEMHFQLQGPDGKTDFDLLESVTIGEPMSHVVQRLSEKLSLPPHHLCVIFDGKVWGAKNVTAELIDNRRMWIVLLASTPNMIMLQRRMLAKFRGDPQQSVGESVCCICLENPVNIALVPCCHEIICSQCEKQLVRKNCPICTLPFHCVAQSLKVFDE